MPVCFRSWVKRHLKCSFISNICMRGCRCSCPSWFIILGCLRRFCRNNNIVNYCFNRISLWTNSLNRKQQCRNRNSFFSRFSFRISLSVAINSCRLHCLSINNQIRLCTFCSDCKMNFLTYRKFIIEVVIIKFSSVSESSVFHDTDIMNVITVIT